MQRARSTLGGAGLKIRSAAAALRLRGGGVTSAAVPLATGAHMPAVGLGLWKVPREACAATVVSAIKQVTAVTIIPLLRVTAA